MARIYYSFARSHSSSSSQPKKGPLTRLNCSRLPDKISSLHDRTDLISTAQIMTSADCHLLAAQVSCRLQRQQMNSSQRSTDQLQHSTYFDMSSSQLSVLKAEYSCTTTSRCAHRRATNSKYCWSSGKLLHSYLHHSHVNIVFN